MFLRIWKVYSWNINFKKMKIDLIVQFEDLPAFWEILHVFNCVLFTCICTYIAWIALNCELYMSLENIVIGYNISFKHCSFDLWTIIQIYINKNHLIWSFNLSIKSLSVTNVVLAFNMLQTLNLTYWDIWIICGFDKCMK